MTAKVFRTAPSFAGLYRKALLGAVRSSGKREDSLPGKEYVLSETTVDLAKLAAYNQVCGFRLSDEVSATYLHVLAFPLHLALMVSSRFPFSTLGILHAANRITQHRPVQLGEPFSIRVRAEGLRSHDKGTQFDVITEVTSIRESSPMWTEVSTYLHREEKASSKRKNQERPLENPSVATMWEIPADIGRRYAEVSGDRNPIHLYPLTARLFGFRSTIAQGMWTAARCLAAFEGELSEHFVPDVQFKAPVLLPAKASFTTDRTSEGWAFVLSNAQKASPYLVGRIENLA